MRRVVTILMMTILGLSVSCWGQGRVTRPVMEKQANVKNQSKSAHTKKKRVRQNKATRHLANGYEYVDLALPSRLKWATTNLGASSPEGKGAYFAWGDTMRRQSYTYCLTSSKDINDLKAEGFITDSQTLAQSQDAASFYRSDGWRIPTSQEFQELIDHCKWEWVESDTSSGYKIIGKNGNSIFLPASGYYLGSKLVNEGEGGHYWTATAYEDNFSAYGLSFSNGSFILSWYNRCFGRVIRPVIK